MRNKMRLLSFLIAGLSFPLVLFGSSFGKTPTEERIKANFPLLLCSNTEDAHLSFYSLYLSESDKKNIHFIIHSLAKYSVIKLGVKNKEIRKKGDAVEHVHPLRFLGYIFGEGGLRDDMRRIRKSSYKWNNFMDNFSNRLNKEASQDNLRRFVPGFAHALGVNPAAISSLIERRDWKGLGFGLYNHP